MKTVQKGTNRPAAVARTNRHAQRTMLPPKVSQREVFEAAIALEKQVPQYGKMTQAQLLDAARKLGLELAKSTPKGKLLEAIMVEVRGAERLARGNAVSEPKKSLPPNPTNPTPMTGADVRSAMKAEALSGELAQHGWSSRRFESDASAYAIILERGVEAIHIAWIDGVFQYESASYTCAERTVKIRNASQARQLGVRGSDAAAAQVTKAVTNKAFKRRPEAAPKRRGALPFDVNLALDDDVISALLGRKVTWLNRISGNEEEATVTPLRKHVQIVEADSGRVLKFIDHVLGFKAFRIADIKEVSAGALTEAPAPPKRKARAKAATADEEAS